MFRALLPVLLFPILASFILHLFPFEKYDTTISVSYWFIVAFPLFLLWVGLVIKFANKIK